ncbi:MAG: ATP-binding protein [Desulfobacterales bacterium]|nr:ATP-binding protein [Desulfobacterales bacterium]
MIIAISLVLMAFTAVMGIDSHNRDEARMIHMLQEKGAALIQGIEAALLPPRPAAGSQNGKKKNRDKGDTQRANYLLLQQMIDAITHQADLFWVIISTPRGKHWIKSPSQAPDEPRNLLDPPFQTGKAGTGIQWRIIRPKGETPYFEIFRPAQWPKGTGQKPLFIFLAMDISHFETARIEDRHHNMIMVAIILALGGAGFIALFWARRDARSKKMLERAQKLAVIGNIAAGVAHEIRNPLSSIKGYATYFATLFPRESHNRKAAIHMAEETDRINRVISELLTFARPSDLNFESISIQELLTHSLTVVDREAKTGNVKLIPRFPELPIVIEADPDRLTQVLLNLYINGIQAMPRGGRLSVSARARTRTVEIKVKDTGSGIPREKLPRIFDPYFTDKARGTGLGLAVSHKIIENHNGTITVETIENHWTCFTITLPLSQEKRKTT